MKPTKLSDLSHLANILEQTRVAFNGSGLSRYSRSVSSEIRKKITQMEDLLVLGVLSLELDAVSGLTAPPATPPQSVKPVSRSEQTGVVLDFATKAVSVAPPANKPEPKPVIEKNQVNNDKGVITVSTTPSKN